MGNFIGKKKETNPNLFKQTIFLTKIGIVDELQSGTYRIPKDLRERVDYSVETNIVQTIESIEPDHMPLKKMKQLQCLLFLAFLGSAGGFFGGSNCITLAIANGNINKEMLVVGIICAVLFVISIVGIYASMLNLFSMLL